MGVRICSSAVMCDFLIKFPCIEQGFPRKRRWHCLISYLTSVLVTSCAITCEVTLISFHLILLLQVLGKFPVIQHFPFGTILSFEPAE